MLPESSDSAMPTAADDDVQEEVKQTSVRRLSDILGPKFHLAFKRAAAQNGGERIMWEVFPMGAPNPLQPGQVVTGLGVFCSIPATVVGQFLSLTAAVDGMIVEADQAVIDEFVSDRLGELLSARSQEVQRARQEAAQAADNGQQSPTGGLIVPGR